MGRTQGQIQLNTNTHTETLQTHKVKVIEDYFSFSLNKYLYVNVTRNSIIFLGKIIIIIIILLPID